MKSYVPTAVPPPATKNKPRNRARPRRRHDLGGPATEFRPPPADKKVLFLTEDQRWEGVVRRDPRADGRYFYSVATTGIYCRPTCPARRANRENVQFHVSAAEAERAGYRPCRRCAPSSGGLRAKHSAAVAEACRRIAASEEFLAPRMLASAVGMSVSHFQRIFQSLTGLTPRAYGIAERARKVREQLTGSKSVTEAIYRAGFNSGGRFYAASSKILGMRPKEFRAAGRGVTIRFAVAKCWLGSMLVAASWRGVCAVTLGDNPDILLRDLQDRFSNAELIGVDREFEKLVAKVVTFMDRPDIGLDLPLDIRGTAFQRRVWQELSRIPFGSTRSYAEIAQAIGRPGAVRAVASACGANHLAVVIPCHRVVRTDGSLSGYRWGVERKAKLLRRERPPGKL